MIDIGNLNGYATNFYQIVLPVLLFSLAIVGYALVIGASYKTMSKRDLFRLKRVEEAREEHKRHPVIRFLIGLFEYGVIFPVIVIVWFSVLSVLLFVLSKELSAETLITIAVALVASVRVLSYFNQEISIDVAKLFPLILLGAFLLEPDFFSLSLLYSRIDVVPTLFPKLVNFLAVPVIVEWVLRILLAIKGFVIRPPSSLK